MWGVVAGSLFLRLDLEFLAPLPRPQHVVKPRVFQVSAGGRGGRERALPYYFLPQVLFQSRAGHSHFSPKLAPTRLAQCLCYSGGSAHSWK